MASPVSPWSALTGKAPDLQCQPSGISCASSGQRRKDPAIWNHSQGARQSLLLPALRVEIWPPVVSGPLFPGRPAPLPASPGRHIFKDGSLLFSSLPPGSLSLKPSAACVQASCSHTSHFCSFLSKSMSKPHDPCIFFYCTYQISLYKKGLHLFLFFYFCSKIISNSISLNFCKHF